MTDDLFCRVISLQDAAKLLGVSVWAMHKAVQRNNIPKIKVKNGKNCYLTLYHIDQLKTIFANAEAKRERGRKRRQANAKRNDSPQD